ncbi:spore germination protein [Sediminibacillus sp. JSM 1682029]|uniref:spore germination protein n=1 Tax=Sediminibacillus sp. JSM 1682029 TaxID=3229857 RepID=UPI003524C6A1
MFGLFKRENSTKEESKRPLYKDLKKNTEEVKKMFSHGVNSDFVYRKVTSNTNKEVSIFFYASIVNSQKIYDGIIKPLFESEKENLRSVIILEDLAESYDFDQVESDINSGKAVIFEENRDRAYAVDVAEFQHRAVEKPENESVVKGPQEAFTESVSVNLSLIRKKIHDKQLIAETVEIGERAKQAVTVMYVSDLVNQDTLKNVRERLNAISVDNVRNIEILEQHIEERPYSIIPTLLYTERSDRAASFLEEGFIVLMMNNSSACLILPVTFWSFFHTPEDRYLRFLFGNFSRIIRFLALIITLFISAVYVAITNYHSEMIPPDLLLAITSARERVPFPGVFEVLLMEISFELIREAGLRIPNPLGPTIGIVGALILGQAAVEANIVSPIIVIIVALSGLSSFAMANISLNYTIRITRFIFIMAASFFGMFSLMGAFLLWLMYLASLKSFGTPFFAPLSPRYPSARDTIFRKTAIKEMLRPGFVKPQDMKKK